jgi:ABC-type Mn2+/Zn2+ transport system permease subunit
MFDWVIMAYISAVLSIAVFDFFQNRIMTIDKTHIGVQVTLLIGVAIVVFLLLGSVYLDLMEFLYCSK